MPSNAPAAARLVPSADDAALRARFVEIVSYALERLRQDRPAPASQRELAAAIGIAATMIGRYLQQQANPLALKFSTIVALARVCQMDVGTLTTWLMEGRAAALQRQPAGSAVDLSATRLAEQLLQQVRQLEQQPLEPPIDYSRLAAELEQRKQQAGTQLFNLAVDTFGAAESLKAVTAQEPLEQRDWELLAALLSMEPEELRRLVVRPAGTAAKSAPMPA